MNKKTKSKHQYNLPGKTSEPRKYIKYQEKSNKRTDKDAYLSNKLS